MKRPILILILVALLVAAGGAAYWLLTQTKTEEASIVSALPEDTILFAHIPDGTASFNRYQESNLKKIVESPELKFLKAWALNLGDSKLDPSQKEDLVKTQDLFNLLARSLDGESFIAVLPVDLKNLKGPGLKEIPVILGLRPKEGPAGADAVIGKIKELLGKDIDIAPKGNGLHDGISYQWVDCPRGVRICEARISDWSITTLSEPTLQIFIDRFQKKINSPSLADAASYKMLRGRLERGEDALVYVNIQTSLEMTQLALEESAVPKGIVSNALNQFRFLSAAGLSVRFRKNQVEDTLIALAPQATRPDLGHNYDPCAFKTIKFTSPDTLAYFAKNFDARKQYEYTLKTYQSTAPESYKDLKSINESVSASGLDLDKNILDAVGPEIGLTLDWPKDNAFPDLALFVELAHPEDFKPVTDLLIKDIEPLTESKTAKDGKIISPTGMIVDGQAGSWQLKTFRFTKTLPVSPTLATGNNFCALFLTEQGAHRTLDKGDGASPGLKENPQFKSSGADIDSACSFLFVDMTQLTNRIYDTARPYYNMALAFSPDLQKTLKNFKPPASLGFVQPLGCWTLTSHVDNEAFTTRSKSGIGTPIFPFLVASGAITAFSEPRAELAKAHVKINVHKKNGETESSSESTLPSEPTTPTTAVSPPAASTPARAEPTAEEIREQLEELRTIIDAWVAEENVPKGTPVTWENLEHYLVKDSSLEKSHGQDPFGIPYSLGIVGEKTCDLDQSTKARFPDKDPAYWAPLSEQ